MGERGELSFQVLDYKNVIFTQTHMEKSWDLRSSHGIYQRTQQRHKETNSYSLINLKFF
ncbi:unnamed protein product [Brassica rapa subsp. narinosa]